MKQKNSLPVDPTAERLVITSMLNSINALNELMPLLKSEDFYSLNYHHLFKVIKSMYQDNLEINVTSLTQQLIERSLYETLGGGTAIVDLLSFSPDSPYMDYFHRLRKVTNLRLLIIEASQLIKDAQNVDADSDELIKKLQDKLHDMQITKKINSSNLSDFVINFEGNKDIAQVVENKIKRKAKGLPSFDGIYSGFEQLDNTLGSFKKGGLYYIGARTSMGKTTFLANIFVNLMQKDVPFLFFSLEMPAATIVQKIFALYCDIPTAAIDDGSLNEEQYERIVSLAEVYKNKQSSMFIDDEAALTIDKVKDRIRRQVVANNIKIVFIDYLTCIRASSKHGSKHLEVDEISKGLQAISKELMIPIVALCQLNRGVANRASPVPTLADFRESGSIEEDADACLLLHRPSAYDPLDKPGISQVIIAKNRIRGILCKIEFHCNVQVSERYHELEKLVKIDRAEVAKPYKDEPRYYPELFGEK